MATTPPEPDRQVSPRWRGMPLWLAAFVGLFLLVAAWAVAEPYNGIPDEASHVYRAVGITYDGPIATGGIWETVPAGLVPNQCWQWQPSKSAECAGEPGGKSNTIQVRSGAGRYNPVYYLILGWPLRLWPNWTGILLARLISAAMVAALLASALWNTVRWPRYRFFAAGALVAITPMTLHLAGGINPSALEIAAGTALLAGLIPLVLDRSTTIGKGLAAQLGLATITLATLRAFGPLWVAIILVTLLLPLRRAVLTKLLWARPMRWWTLAGAVGVLAGVGWTMAAGTGSIDLVELPPHMTILDALRVEIYNRSSGYVHEMVGNLSWLDTPLPEWIYMLWYAAFGLLVIGALAWGGRGVRWRIAVLSFCTFAVPIGLDTLEANTYGLVSQARYVLPIAVGIPMLAAFAIDKQRILDPLRASQLVRVLAAILMPVQVFALGYTMIRWQHGLGGIPHGTSFNPLTGNWIPPLGTELPLTLGVLGAVLLYLWFRRVSSPAVPLVGDGLTANGTLLDESMVSSAVSAQR